MSWDIYGNPLRRGHCEVHPHVHEEYPCSVCLSERKIFNQQQPNYELDRLNHELDQQNDYIKELTVSNQNLNMALQKVSDYNLRLEESNKSFVSALQKAEAYNVQLENDRDALMAQNHELKGLIMRLRDRWWPFVHGSVAPSNTAYNLGKESADVLCKSPQQHLADIRAEAGRAGYYEGYVDALGDADEIDKEHAAYRANQYAKVVRNEH